MAQPRFMTVGETAAYLRCSPETVRRRIREGLLETALPYKPWRIDRLKFEHNKEGKNGTSRKSQ